MPSNSPNDVVVVHAIIPVKVKPKGSTETVTTYAFYDNGSGGCFLTENLREQLGVQGQRTKLQLGTMLGRNLVDSTIVDDLVVTDMKDSNPVEIPRLYTRTEIPVTDRQIPTPGMVQRWQHLHEIAKLIPEFQPDLEIGLLIGSNCPVALEPLEVVPSRGEGPFAMRLRHGWTLNGPLCISNTSQSDITCHRITLRETNDTVKEVISPEAIGRMFEMDFNDHKVGPDERSFSQEDKKFLTKMDNGIRLTKGHYETPLPFRNPEMILPNNRNQVLKRALWQKKKMQRDTKYHRDYSNFMNEIIWKGYARKIPENEVRPASGQVWYIPHHGVYHPKKPEKIRVVFYCSADYAGTSLNKLLLQGPDLTNSLIGVLTRFRKEPIAFMADVEAMFHQVWVPEEQWNYLRFLWWPEGDLNGEIEEYQMVVHLFGAVSSPSCCNYALRKTAADNESDYPVVAETIRRNFYVDDCLRSDTTEEGATKLAQDLKMVCAKGGFRLTKFVSNSRALLETIPVEERSKETRTLDLNRDMLPIEHALGMQWCVELDVFEFRIVLTNKPPTRRGILSTVSSVYDPLGFAAPFILPAKKILQDPCHEDIGWDDEVSDEHKIPWERWLTELPLLQKLQVPRCVRPKDFGKVVSQEIHIFSDASITGYGAVAYLRLCDESDNIHCSFLMGKARLAPMKIVTIPRLELTAAAVSVRIGALLKSELDDIYDLKYHTDSTTVLRYIINEQQRFHVFVANRVQLIRDYSNPNQWRYVETYDNPADDASRGTSGERLLQQRRWFEGPEFLWKPEQEWPQQPIDMGQISNDDPEIKH